jgi:hypothetical protein
LNYSYKIINAGATGIFVKESIGSIATCNHSLLEILTFEQYLNQDKKELSEYILSGLRTREYLLNYKPELLL